ncbi:MAG: DRTGG domain-containing protein [Cellulosilyticaceae bacterium]
MKLQEVKTLLNAQVWAGEERLEKEVFAACGCDLMSDVLAFAKEKVLLLTGLVNPQVIRTAEMLDIKAIVFVRGKKPSEEMIAMAKEKQMIILSTESPLYTACGKLYHSGLTNGEEV